MMPFKEFIEKDSPLVEGRKEILNEIPTSELSEVIADFESEGAKVSTKKGHSGNWTVIAVFKD